MRRTANTRKGATLVEGALVLSTLLIMILTIMDLGQMLFFLQLLNDRCREGARYATVSTYDTNAIKRYIAYGDAGSNRTGTGLFGLTPAMIAVNRYGANTPEDRIEVIIQNFPLTYFSPLLYGQYGHRPFRVVTLVESLGASN
ncbi:MAG: TadE/TadG family type IV pilus assembly protein [Bryobacteraceae bacterium]